MNTENLVDLINEMEKIYELKIWEEWSKLRQKADKETENRLDEIYKLIVDALKNRDDIEIEKNNYTLVIYITVKRDAKKEQEINEWYRKEMKRLSDWKLEALKAATEGRPIPEFKIRTFTCH